MTDFKSQWKPLPTQTANILPTRTAAIVMVDDPSEPCRRLSQSLESEGFQVVETSNGAEDAAPAEGAPTPALYRPRPPQNTGDQPPFVTIMLSKPARGSFTYSTAGAAMEDEPVPRQKQFQSGPLCVDFEERMVKVAGSRIKLTLTEYSILQILIERAGKVVTHHQIARKIWGDEGGAKKGCLRVFVLLLRRKLRNSLSSDLLLTERGVGYRLALFAAEAA